MVDDLRQPIRCQTIHRTFFNLVQIEKDSTGVVLTPSLDWGEVVYLTTPFKHLCTVMLLRGPSSSSLFQEQDRKRLKNYVEIADD